MPTDAVETRFLELLRKTLGTVSLPTRFQDVPGWDSLRFAELIIELQREFKIQLAPQDIFAAQTAQDLLTILKGKKPA